MKSLKLTFAILLLAGISHAQCLTAAKSWQNIPIIPESQAFSADFNVTPGASPADLVIGFSNGNATTWANMAAIVRFDSSTGSVGGKPVVIDAMNGTAYAELARIFYAAKTVYHIHMAIRPATQSYDVLVGPLGNRKGVAVNYAFRASSGPPTTLNNFVMYDDVATDSICNLAIAPVPAAVPVLLNWVGSTSPGITGYNIYRSQTSGSFPSTPIGTVAANTTSYIDTSAAPGQSYFYVVTAISPLAQSADSNQATAAIPSL